jgi:hypothetical protein
VNFSGLEGILGRLAALFKDILKILDVFNSKYDGC